MNFSGEPTDEFKKYYTKNICRFVGRCFKRQPGLKDKSLVDPYVTEWKGIYGKMWENKYRMAVPTKESNYLGSSKYEREQPVLDEYAWKLSGKWMVDHWFPYLQDSVVVRQDVALSEMDKSKSSGYPHNQNPSTAKKRDYIKSADFARNDEEYYNFLSSRDDYVPCFWNLADKYELRSAEKLAEGKIRAFTACSIHHSVANSRLCHDMNQKFYASHLKTWSFVGATKFNGEWNNMIRKLQKFANGFELDMKDYDASMFRRALMEMAEVRFNYLAPEHRTEENRLRMFNLYDDVVNSIMVTPLGDVIVKDTGNPSGQGNTIVDNTMILYRLFCYAFIMLWRKKFAGDAVRIEQIRDVLTSVYSSDSDVDEEALEDELRLLSSRRLSQAYMHANVLAMLNGDDNSFTCSDGVVSWFNATTVKEELALIGVTVKTPCETPRPAEQLGFLSQQSILDPISNKYLPIPEHERIMDSLELASESTDIRWSLLRAYALRIESWACVKTRALVWSYIQFVWKTYPHLLTGATVVPKTGVPMSYEDISQTLMTDADLRRLYTGLECEQTGPESNWSLRCREALERVKLIL